MRGRSSEEENPRSPTKGAAKTKDCRISREEWSQPALPLPLGIFSFLPAFRLFFFSLWVFL